MNLKTTLGLLVLVAIGAAMFPLAPWLGEKLKLTPPTPDTAGAGTLAILSDELTPEKITYVKVEVKAEREGDETVLERGAGGDWSMPGQWPARQAEVQELVNLLGNLRSRFVPETNIEDMKRFGLVDLPVRVTVKASDKEYQLKFGEGTEESNRFSRPTYLQIAEKSEGEFKSKNEVVRLAPGLLASLKRTHDYYQQRRLFPSERVAEGDSGDKTERLAAHALSVKSQGGSYELARVGDSWDLIAPVRDRPDPDKLKSILAAVPDLWAEQFVAKLKKTLADFGLDKPEQTIVVRRGEKDKPITLLVGKQSQMKVRKVSRPSPPGMPMPPREEMVHEEYRYAKLDNNDQVFEIKADKLKDLTVPVDTLRDSHLARFKTEDVRKLEIVLSKGEQIVLSKDKDRWKLQKPMEGDAESTKVTELLDKLRDLQAQGKDLIDNALAKTYGFDKTDQPIATIKITAEESPASGGRQPPVPDDSKPKKTKTYTFVLGKHDLDKNKLYAKVDDWPRVNALEDSFFKLVERPAIAYRGRRILDFFSNDLDSIEVARGGEKFQLKHAQGAWRLASPIQTDADTSKASSLADDLSRLEVVEFINNSPKPEELETRYGLGKNPPLSASLNFTDKKKKPETLLIGKQREGKPEYYAKLASGPAVFAVKKEIHDALDQNSLAFRPLQLWQFNPEEVASLRIQRQNEPEFRLHRDGSNWKIAGPFDAAVSGTLVQDALSNLAPLRCERFESHVPKELSAFGLDKPYLRLALSTEDHKKEPGNEKKPPAAGKEEPKERVLLIGKPTAPNANTRFAKLGSSEAVFVVSDKVVAAVDHSPLDLLDRKLLALDAKSITRIQTTSAANRLNLERKGNQWQVDVPAAKFTADPQAMTRLLNTWFSLQAERFAAFGAKLDLAKYGLDKPAVTAMVTVAASDPKSKPVEHKVVLGKPVENNAEQRYARVDDGAGVIVLPAFVVAELSLTYLDFVDRAVLNFDAEKLTGIQRKMAGQELEVVKRDDSWSLTKPAANKGDTPGLDSLSDQLAHLRANRIAAYPVKDLKPFGLDQPAAVVTLRATGADGKPTNKILKIGQAADKNSEKSQPQDRYAIVEGSTAVAVLPGALADRLLAAPLRFRDRNVARFAEADRVVLERGSRGAVFAKIDGTWKMTQPLDAEAEHDDLNNNLVDVVARLRADELVAEKPADLKAYGLDRPEARWRFFSGDKEVLGLLIGNMAVEKGGKKDRCYAKLAAGDLVFLLDPKVTKNVLAEYRSRGTGSLIDASQVERVTYRYARNPFVLEKVDNNWRVVGRADAKVNATAVNDALAALANLKVERYVVDKGADLKLYGLEPPQLVLEAQTQTGTRRTLHIGNKEGDSKRYYARVPEANRTDVFVISEGDAAKIVRELAGFLEGTAKPPAKLSP